MTANFLELTEFKATTKRLAKGLRVLEERIKNVLKFLKIIF
jgi:hypothetical protein